MPLALGFRCPGGSSTSMPEMAFRTHAGTVPPMCLPRMSIDYMHPCKAVTSTRHGMGHHQHRNAAFQASIK
jgi:hypothetical protein